MDKVCWIGTKMKRMLIISGEVWIRIVHTRANARDDATN